MEKENVDYLKDRHLLIAVDDSENAKRAILYVADVLRGSHGFRATILNVIPEPPEEPLAPGNTSTLSVKLWPLSSCRLSMIIPSIGSIPPQPDIVSPVTRASPSVQPPTTFLPCSITFFISAFPSTSRLLPPAKASRLPKPRAAGRSAEASGQACIPLPLE